MCYLCYYVLFGPPLAPGPPAASNPNGDPHQGRASGAEAYHYSGGTLFSWLKNGPSPYPAP